MTPQPELEPPQAAARETTRLRMRRPALIGAIGLTVVAALIFAYELTAALKAPSIAQAVETADTGAAPVPLSSQPISFLDQPQAVPEIKFVDGDGRPASLSDFRGRPILLNVWATWCLPCRQEMPSLDRLQAKFDPEKFRVLALSIDRMGAPAVKKFYADIGLKSLGVYVDESGAAQHQLGLVGIPATLLINADGQEIGRKLGPAEWDSPEILSVLQEHLGVKVSTTQGTSP